MFIPLFIFYAHEYGQMKVIVPKQNYFEFISHSYKSPDSFYLGSCCEVIVKFDTIRVHNEVSDPWQLHPKFS